MNDERTAPAPAMPTREVFQAGGWALLGALTALNFVDDFGITAFAVVAPDIQDTLQLSDASIAMLGALGGALILFAVAPAAMAADRYRRLTVISISSVLLGVFSMLTGLAQSGWQLVVARVGAGLGKGNLPAFNSVITDAVPIAGRARAFSLFNSSNALANIVTPAFVGLVVAVAGGPDGWRWAFLACGLPTVVLGLVAGVQREPERGRYERESALGADALLAADGVEANRAIPMTEAFARLKRIRTFYAMTLGFAAVGAALFAVPTFMNLLLEDRYGLDTGERGLFGSVSAVGLLAGTIVAGTVGDRLYARDPRLLLRWASWCVLGYLLMVPAIHMPNAVALTAFVTLANVGMSAAFTLVGVAAANIIPPGLRSMGFAMVTLYLAVVGGLGGAGVGGVLSGQYGERTALTIVLVGVVPLGALYMRRGSAFILDDVEAVARDLREEDARRRRRVSRGTEPIAGEPLLEIAHLDVAYGPLQVLFDVDLEVRRGEVLALLGTNGAGKSTLLRAVTGLTFPNAGTVVMDGEDITYMEPADRVTHGVVMVPGGKAIFGSLSVEDNLRLGGFLLLDDERRYRTREAEVLDLFPALRERLRQPAGTLSGGERQMLALAKAMLLEPTLLCIDELSLGLAPIVVAELIEVVAGLRADGMTMVIVEQSVNVALTLADRAVFMEKGHLRFEGSASELLERDDLVRAVFLGGDRG